MPELDRTKILIGAAILLILLVVTVPLFGSMNKKSLRAEVPLNVDSIRMAEISYHSAFESYVSAKAAPREPLDVDSKAVPWAATDGFGKLSWEPEQTEVRGSYAVNAKRGGFTVMGVCDVDEDDKPARFQATLEEEGRALTDSDVY